MGRDLPMPFTMAMMMEPIPLTMAMSTDPGVTESAWHSSAAGWNAQRTNGPEDGFKAAYDGTHVDGDVQAEGGSLLCVVCCCCCCCCWEEGARCLIKQAKNVERGTSERDDGGSN